MRARPPRVETSTRAVDASAREPTRRRRDPSSRRRGAGRLRAGARARRRSQAATKASQASRGGARGAEAVAAPLVVRPEARRQSVVIHQVLEAEREVHVQRQRRVQRRGPQRLDGGAALVDQRGLGRHPGHDVAVPAVRAGQIVLAEDVQVLLEELAAALADEAQGRADDGQVEPKNAGSCARGGAKFRGAPGGFAVCPSAPRSTRGSRTSARRPCSP